MSARSVVYLALGSNLGDRQANLAEALRRLKEAVAIDRVSSIYETEPAGHRDQPDFLNAVCRGRTSLDPQGLLAFVKRIERDMGRRPSFRNAPRPIDIDILLYGRLRLDRADLTIPHRRIAERPFVLVPLAEIAPHAVHPVLHKSAASLAKAAGAVGVRRVGPLDANMQQRAGAGHRGVSNGGGRYLELSATVDSELVEPVTELFARYAGGNLAIVHAGSDSSDSAAGETATTVKAYLPIAGSRRRRSRIEAGLALLGLIRPIPALEVTEIAEEEWLSALRGQFSTIHVGRRLVIRPQWERYEPSPGEIVIVLDPGLAFGTGHHPTTRLCLAALERHVKPGVGVLDMGTGSGILAIAAALLGAARVVAIDRDRLAVRAARRNVRINGLSRRIDLHHGNLPPESPGGFDLACMNISAAAARPLLPLVAGKLRQGGLVILSGLLEEQEREAGAAATAAGLAAVERTSSGEWLALVFRKEAGG